MGIERLHDDYDTNRRQRLLAMPSVEDQLAQLWDLLLPLIDERKLRGKSKEHVSRVKHAKEQHPEDND